MEAAEREWEKGGRLGGSGRARSWAGARRAEDGRRKKGRRGKDRHAAPHGIALGIKNMGICVMRLYLPMIPQYSLSFLIICHVSVFA
jgi:hypothetical protein